MTGSRMVQVSLAMPEKLLKEIEEKKQNLSRSEYIRRSLAQVEEERVRKQRNVNGAVYTPRYLAEYVAGKALGYFLSANNSKSIPLPTPINILDPACGDGELIVAITNAIANGKREACRSDLFRFHGLDIDEKAIAHAKKRLEDTEHTNFVRTNGLCPYNKPSRIGWERLKKRLKVQDGFDVIIANPPWGADLSSYRKPVSESDFELFQRQFDTCDLFLELSLRLLKGNGIGAFIVPDSLFSQERWRLRKILSERTTLKFVGRFGEKIFKDINRACAVVIFQNKPPRATNKVDCFRLNPTDKKLVLRAEKSLLEIEKNALHRVDQSRFRESQGNLFNIDLDTKMETVFNRILNSQSKIAHYLSSTRGIELSKKGNVICCPECKKWFPKPNQSTFICFHCREFLSVADCVGENIIQKFKSTGFGKLIVGEDISRFSASQKLWINLKKKGINYKDREIYVGPKLIVRKTGVGVSASIDYTESFVNQVVYIFKSNDIEGKIPLEFFLILISSRLMFFYITMINGDNEWKSHPYLTQKQILELPIPLIPEESSNLLKRIRSICRRVEIILREGQIITSELDAACEKLVADVFGLKKSDYKIIYKVISEAQELLPVKALRNISVSDIFVSREKNGS